MRSSHLYRLCRLDRLTWRFEVCLYAYRAVPLWFDIRRNVYFFKKLIYGSFRWTFWHPLSFALGTQAPLPLPPTARLYSRTLTFMYYIIIYIIILYYPSRRLTTSSVVFLCNERFMHGCFFATGSFHKTKNCRYNVISYVYFFDFSERIWIGYNCECWCMRCFKHAHGNKH